MLSDLRHVRSFLAAARAGTFTRAAAEVHISQSAFTVQIRQLEEELDAQLFDRGKRRVALTAIGRDLLVPLERLLADAAAVAGRTRQLAGLQHGLVSMAALPSVAVGTLLPGAILKFTQTYPGIAVQIHDLVAEHLIEAVKQEQVDFGIGSRMRPDRELKTTPLFDDRLRAFVPQGHRLAKRNSILLKDLSAYPLILTTRDCSLRRLLERVLQHQRLPVTVAYETHSMMTVIAMVRAGLGIAVLPEIANGGARLGKIRTIAIDNPRLSRTIEIIQRRDRSLSPAALKMVELIEQCASPFA
jgi:DNA-binding transcriptional LysR family regulator